MSFDRFARNSIFGTIAGLSSALGSFLGMVIVARTLGPVGSGVVSMGIWLAGTAVTFADLGLPLTVSRFVPELNAREQNREARAFAPYFFKMVLATTAIVVALCGVLGVGGAEWLRDHVRFSILSSSPDSIWLVVGFVFACQAIGNFGLSTLRGEQRFDRAAKLTTLGAPIQLIAMAGGAIMGGAEGALLGYAVGGMATASVALRLIGAKVDLPEELKRRSWRFAVNSWIVGVISTIVWSRVELAFLDYWRGAREAGLYSVAYTLCALAVQGPMLMTGGLLAYFSERYAVSDQSGLEEAYAQAVRFMCLLLFPACFGMAAITPVILPLLFGDAFSDAAPAAAILVGAQALGAISTVSSTFLMSVERGAFLVRVGLLGVLCSLLAGVTVIPFFGLEGAVISRASVQGLLTILAFIFIEKRLQCPFPLGAVLRITAAALGCAIAARAIIVIWPQPVALFLAIPAAAVLYVAAILAFRALNPSDIRAVRTVANRLIARSAPLLAAFQARRRG